MKSRRVIINAVLCGDIDEAIAQVETAYPTFFTAWPVMLFKLRCRKFAELVAKQHCNGAPAADAPPDARVDVLLSLGKELQELYDQLEPASPADLTLLQDTFSLLAYTQPAACPVAHLLEPTPRRALAKVV